MKPDGMGRRFDHEEPVLGCLNAGWSPGGGGEEGGNERTN